MKQLYNITHRDWHVECTFWSLQHQIFYECVLSGKIFSLCCDSHFSGMRGEGVEPVSLSLNMALNSSVYKITNGVTTQIDCTYGNLDSTQFNVFLKRTNIWNRWNFCLFVLLNRLKGEFPQPTHQQPLHWRFDLRHRYRNFAMAPEILKHMWQVFHTSSHTAPFAGRQNGMEWNRKGNLKRFIWNVPQVTAPHRFSCELYCVRNQEAKLRWETEKLKKETGGKAVENRISSPFNIPCAVFRSPAVTKKRAQSCMPVEYTRCTLTNELSVILKASLTFMLLYCNVHRTVREHFRSTALAIPHIEGEIIVYTFCLIYNFYGRCVAFCISFKQRIITTFQNGRQCTECCRAVKLTNI
jgi:hypothetical protein